MPEAFVVSTATARRLRSCVLGPYLDAFCAHLAELGYRPATIRSKLGDVGDLARWLEVEQAEAYRRVLEAFGPEHPVVIRLAYANPDLLLTQLRAIWRAGAAAKVVPHVMALMVATLADVELLMSLRDRARDTLVGKGLPVAERMVTGIMIEVPSAAFLAPELARRVDFFSIGTNDLTQYVLAADRGNAALAGLQDALHPAVLRAIAGIVAGADSAGIPVAVCGELAGDPAGSLVLVGPRVAWGGGAPGPSRGLTPRRSARWVRSCGRCRSATGSGIASRRERRVRASTSSCACA